MKRIFSTTCFSFILLTLLSGQSAPNFWKVISQDEIALPENTAPIAVANDFTSLTLDFNAMVNHLRQAPFEGTPEAKSGALQVQLPMPDGTMETFKIWESPVMHPDLAARYPMIRTFAGRGISDPTHIVRCGYSPNGGFHAFIPSERGGSIIEQYALNQTEYYMCRSHTAEPADGNYLPKVNLVEAGPQALPEDGETITHDNELTFRGGGEGSLAKRHDYIFAVAAAGEFSETYGGTVENVLASIVTTVNTMNSLLERDIDVRFALHPNNDQLIYLDPETDPYSPFPDDYALIDQNLTVLNQKIGLESYDIGHLYTRYCTEFAGVAGGTVCSQFKGRGATCFGNSLIGTTIRVAAHEIMHQFSGGHTFNNCPGQEDQFQSGSAREPGSGSTILSYQGACGGGNNIPGSPNVMYNAGNIMEVWTYTNNTGGNLCGAVTETSNHSPEITLNYTDGFYIPINTPFELEASASDEDGDPLTYSWEQMNRTPSAQLGQPVGDAPTFRVYDPTTTTKRIFPRLPVILDNTSEIVEVLPAYDKTLDFRVVVRDNNIDEGAGGMTWEDVSFKATSTAGPFLVTSPNTSGVVWKAGEEVEITWDVANTDNDLVNCKSVNIYLSTTGGNSFPYLLVASTPNDGSEVITVPDLAGTNTRIKIEAANNIFFDLSNQNFEITQADEPTYSVGMSPQFQQICVPDLALIELNIGGILNFDQPVELDITGGLPTGAIYEFSNNPVLPGESTTLSIDVSTVTADGLFELELSAVSGTNTTVRSLFLDLVYSDFSALTLDGPTDGQSELGLLPTFTWADLPQADHYDIQLATSPTFEPGTIVDEVFDLTGNTFVSDVALLESTLYFWRIRPGNDCKEADYTLTHSFQTFTTDCKSFDSPDVPKVIPQLGLPVIESEVLVLDAGIIADVNISTLSGVHDALRHLKVSLVSPSATEVVLFDQICGNVSLFDFGMNDESPFDIDCPPLNGLDYKPQEPLSTFDGENTQGTWTLKVAVVDAEGEGGTFKEWGLEFCASVTPDHPFLVNNETIYVRPEETRVIHNFELYADDPDNPGHELKLMILNDTRHGYLSKNGQPIGPGDQFSLVDINQEAITYTNTDPDATGDFFTFIVTDGKGGLFGTPRFNIVIDENAITDVEEQVAANQLMLYPNPAHSKINLAFQQPLESESDINVTDAQGRLVATQRLAKGEQQVRMDLAGYTSGVYFLTVRTESGVMAKRFVVSE